MPDPKQYDPYWADPLYKLRYGVGAAEKHDISLSGQVPGSPGSSYLETDPAKLDQEERRTAGYLLGQKWPTAGPLLTRAANVVRHPITAGALPMLLPFSDSPERVNQLHATAMESVNQGAEDAKSGRYLAASRQPAPGAPPRLSATAQSGMIRSASPNVSTREY